MPTGNTILIVEDEPDVLASVEQRATYYGLEVLSASSAEEALSILADHPNTVAVIIDLFLPKVDGFQLATYLRSEGYTGKLFGETANTSTEVERQCQEAGFDGYFPKPFDRNFSQALQELAVAS